VTTMVSPRYSSGRNVVGDNFFTSVALVEELHQQGLTYVGTMRKNKRDIPPPMFSRNRQELSSAFAFHENKTLVSYVPKKYKSVVLISTMHHDTHVDTDMKKPDIILHYNDTKSGVDNMGHIVTVFSCKQKINRWPMVLFFNMVDVAALASFTVWLCNVPDWRKVSKCARRRHFLVELGEQLVKPLISRRLGMPTTLRQNVRDAISTVGAKLQLANELATTPTDKPASGQGRCYVCARSRDRKVRKFCSSPGKAVCAEHREQTIMQQLSVVMAEMTALVDT